MKFASNADEAIFPEDAPVVTQKLKVFRVQNEHTCTNRYVELWVFQVGSVWFRRGKNARPPHRSSQLGTLFFGSRVLLQSKRKQHYLRLNEHRFNRRLTSPLSLAAH